MLNSYGASAVSSERVRRRSRPAATGAPMLLKLGCCFIAAPPTMYQSALNVKRSTLHIPFSFLRNN
jgi:hypothetical protein